MRLRYSRSMVAGCAAATAGDSEKSRLPVPCFEQKLEEEPVVLECFCRGVERILIELSLF